MKKMKTKGSQKPTAANAGEGAPREPECDDGKGIVKSRPDRWSDHIVHCSFDEVDDDRDRDHAAVVIQAVARGRFARQGYRHLQTVFQWLKGTRSKRAASKVLKDVFPVVTAGSYCKRLPAVHEAFARACKECALRHGLGAVFAG